MRLLLAALALIALVGASPVRRVAPTPALPVGVTAENGFRIGSPSAPVQLVEYASLTCPHCRAFHSEGWAVLKRDYVAKGLVAVEVRSMVLNGPDVVATLIARCDGAATFFRRVDAFYDQQPNWIAPFGQVTPAQAAAVAKLPALKQFAAMGRAGKLDAFAAKIGVPPKRYDACVGDAAGLARVEALGKGATARGVTGTPTFFLNGAKIETNTWAGVEPLIRGALKLPPKAG